MRSLSLGSHSLVLQFSFTPIEQELHWTFESHKVFAVLPFLESPFREECRHLAGLPTQLQFDTHISHLLVTNLESTSSKASQSRQQVGSCSTKHRYVGHSSRNLLHVGPPLYSVDSQQGTESSESLARARWYLQQQRTRRLALPIFENKPVVFVRT